MDRPTSIDGRKHNIHSPMKQACRASVNNFDILNAWIIVWWWNWMGSSKMLLITLYLCNCPC